MAKKFLQGENSVQILVLAGAVVVPCVLWQGGFHVGILVEMLGPAREQKHLHLKRAEIAPLLAF